MSCPSITNLLAFRLLFSSSPNKLFELNSMENWHRTSTYNTTLMFLLSLKAYVLVKISVNSFFFCLWLLFCALISFSIWCRNNYFWLVVSISFCSPLLKIYNVISRSLFHRARRGNIPLFSSVSLYHACSDSRVYLTQFNLHLICSTSISAFIRRGAFISVHRIAFIS